MTAVSTTKTDTLPAIPQKRYFTIGEVSELCAVKTHVLRYWEQEFPQLKPVKRRGNRRYYQRHDIELIRRIRSLLYDQGFTIAGARQQLENDRKKPLEATPSVSTASNVAASKVQARTKAGERYQIVETSSGSAVRKNELAEIRLALEAVLQILRQQK